MAIPFDIASNVPHRRTHRLGRIAEYFLRDFFVVDIHHRVQRFGLCEARSALFFDLFGALRDHVIQLQVTDVVYPRITTVEQRVQSLTRGSCFRFPYLRGRADLIRLQPKRNLNRREHALFQGRAFKRFTLSADANDKRALSFAVLRGEVDAIVLVLSGDEHRRVSRVG